MQKEGTPKSKQAAQSRITLSRALIVIFVITAIILLGFRTSNPQQPAPDFTLDDIHGNRVTLNNYRGTVVLLEFTATWCDTCEEQTAKLLKISQSYGRQVVIISISVDPSYDTVDRLATYVKTQNISWIVCRDTKDVTQTYRVEMLPSLFLIDQHQTIRWQHKTGNLVSSETLSEQITRLLKEHE